MTPAGKQALRAGALLALAGLLASGLLAGVHALTRERIAEAEQQARRDALAIVLPASLHDNDPDADAVTVIAPAWLGGVSRVQRARLAGKDAALVMEVTAHDGYAGDIGLLVGVDRQGRVTGVRVTRHQETPGLGDAIDASRSDWIRSFLGRALGDPPEPRWAVRKDGGDFDQFAGATITPRAVVRAVRRCLQFVARHGAAVHAAPAGSQLRFNDAPEAGAVP